MTHTPSLSCLFFLYHSYIPSFLIGRIFFLVVIRFNLFCKTWACVNDFLFSYQECRFTKCNFCTLVKNELFKYSASKEDKQYLTSIVHGFGAFNYFDFRQWPHDCNLTLCTILYSLIKVVMYRPLPPHLFVQINNCVRGNKNKYVMGFLALLVQEKIFKEVFFAM